MHSGPQSKSNLRVGFLGAGRVANWHTRFFEAKQIRGATVSKVCDLLIEKAEALAMRLSCATTASFRELLDDPSIDVIIVMTESGKHFEHAKAGITAGKHVIVEKPPCMLPDQVFQLKDLASSHGVMFAPIFQNRFNPAMRVAKRAMESNRLGKLVSASVRVLWCREQQYYEDGWHGTWRMDGGVLNQQAIHHIDALHWVCGPIKEVFAFQARRLNMLEAEDTTVGLVRFMDGALGTVELTTAARPRDITASLSIVGEKGTIEIGGLALNEITRWDLIDSAEEDEGIIEANSVAVENGYGYSHGPLLQMIFDTISEGSIVPPIEVNSTVDTMRIIHSLYRSVEDGMPISIEDNFCSRRLGVNPSAV